MQHSDLTAGTLAEFIDGIPKSTPITVLINKKSDNEMRQMEAYVYDVKYEKNFGGDKDITISAVIDDTQTDGQ